MEQRDQQQKIAILERCDASLIETQRQTRRTGDGLHTNSVAHPLSIVKVGCQVLKRSSVLVL